MRTAFHVPQPSHNTHRENLELMGLRHHPQPLVGLHRLRPLPLPESHHEFNSGDNVEAFRKDRWWEGRVTETLGNGRFIVSFNDSEEITFSKELLRAPLQWINQ
ncbi:hypothetical protein JHK82_025001 [Glycine max]|nr:hypothetical protein JHK85_025618 [Glycine max]KAG5012860.1 hypothetical protein JHK86_025121 [Glycine max]KAG5133813.1 hypothetical protein JHK82_025001 [Glycine max]